MTLQTFPVLPGQGISVHKKPKWATVVAPHASGRESRARRYQWPLWDFELTFDGLDATPSGYYGSIGALTFQQLVGFYNQMQGAYAPFLYVDPTDHQVFGQQLGIGDGVTTTYTMVRSIGPFTGPVDVVTNASQLYLNGVLQLTGWQVTNQYPFPQLTFSSPPAPGAIITANFQYSYLVRFSDDVQDFEEFLTRLIALKTTKFQSVRIDTSGLVLPQPPQISTIIIIDDPAITVWPAPISLIAVMSVEAFAGGSGGGSGDYGRWAGNGGGYAIAFSPPIQPGQSCQLVVGPGGGGGNTPGNPSDLGGGGGDTIFYLGTGNPYLLTTIVHAYGNGSSGFPSGHPGGQPGAQIPYLTHGSGPAGGGAGGPHGPGANGADGIQNSVYGPGGGAADGGTAGTPGTSSVVGGATTAGVGGTAWDGSPGGAQGSPWGPNGIHGSGGAGGMSGLAAGAGGPGITYNGTPYLTSSSNGGPGGGGGGGGGGLDPGRLGGPGGKWGGGGGAGGNTSPFTNFQGGPGGVGGIIITVQLG